MKECKREFRYFTIMDYEKEGDYLQERHRQGWKFRRVYLPGIYEFERAAPEDVAYQLDYNQEGIQNKTEYVQMFEDCGWEYIQDFVGYSYFRKPAAQMEGSEEIFCDDESRLDMMKRIFKGRMIPLVVVFFCIIIPQLIWNSSRQALDYPILITFMILFILYLMIFIGFTIKYMKFQGRVNKR